MTESEFLTRLVRRRLVIFGCCAVAVLVTHWSMPALHARGVDLPEWSGVVAGIGVYILFVIHTAFWPTRPRATSIASDDPARTSNSASPQSRNSK